MARARDGFHSYQCSRKGVVVSADGKKYCKQHLPENIEARAQALRAKWDAEYATKRRRRDLGQAARDAADALMVAVRSGKEEEILIRAELWEKAVSDLDNLSGGVSS